LKDTYQVSHDFIDSANDKPFKTYFLASAEIYHQMIAPLVFKSSL